MFPDLLTIASSSAEILTEAECITQLLDSLSTTPVTNVNMHCIHYQRSESSSNYMQDALEQPTKAPFIRQQLGQAAAQLLMHQTWCPSKMGMGMGTGTGTINQQCTMPAITGKAGRSRDRWMTRHIEALVKKKEEAYIMY
eukprot:g36160.t1